MGRLIAREVGAGPCRREITVTHQIWEHVRREAKREFPSSGAVKTARKKQVGCKWREGWLGGRGGQRRF